MNVQQKGSRVSTDDPPVHIGWCDSAPPLLTTRDVAAWLRVHPETVERWRRTGEGPRFRRLTGGAVRYTVEDITAFVAVSARTSTADPGSAKL